MASVKGSSVYSVSGAKKERVSGKKEETNFEKQIRMVTNIRKCEQDKCNKEFMNNKEFAKEFQGKFIELYIEAIKNKYTKKEYKEKIGLLLDQGMKSKTNIALLKCAVKKCNEHMRDLVNLHIESLKAICKKAVANEDSNLDKNDIKLICKFCKDRKDGYNKTITFDEYMEIIHLANKIIRV